MVGGPKSRFEAKYPVNTITPLSIHKFDVSKESKLKDEDDLREMEISIALLYSKLNPNQTKPEKKTKDTAPNKTQKRRTFGH